MQAFIRTTNKTSNPIPMFTTLGTGIYTLPDAARILGLRLSKLRRWLKGSEEGMVRDAPGRYGVTAFGIEGTGREKHMDFLSLIELYTVMRLREWGVSFSTIRRAREDLARRLRVDHPFAVQTLFIDGARLLTEDNDLQYELGTNGQIAMRSVLEPFLQRIDFEDSTQLAQRFYPQGREHHVVVDPHRSFGRPVVSNTSITTEAIASLFKGGESIEALTLQFDLNEPQVRDALSFENCLAA